MNLTINKPKTKSGLSYILKSSFLREKLESLGKDLNVIIQYRTPNYFDNGYPVFSCQLWLPNPRVDYERYYIQVGPVKVEDKAQSELLVQQDVIPSFITWLKRIIQLPDNSTYFRQKVFFSAVIKNGKVHIQSSD